MKIGNIREIVHQMSVQVTEIQSEIKTIIFFSPDNDLSKYTLLLNLALQYAQAQQRVLIVDTNFADNRIQKTLKLTSHEGLSDFINEQDHDFRKFVNKTTFKNLDVMLSGQPVESGATILENPRVSLLLEQCRLEYDKVIINTTATSQTRVSANLARQADGVFLISKLKYARKKGVYDLVKQLRYLETNIIGYVNLD